NCGGRCRISCMRVLAFIFGRWSWEAPEWLRWTRGHVARSGRAIAAHPIRAWVSALILSAAAAGTAWYLTRPKPHYVTYTVTEPGLTEYNVNGIPSIKPLTILFNESAAPLKQIRTVVTSGVELSPQIPGTWFWTSDKELRFTPKDDWPVDGAFAVRLAA